MSLAIIGATKRGAPQPSTINMAMAHFTFLQSIVHGRLIVSQRHHQATPHRQSSYI
jgi:hypothetical protein